MAIKIITCPWCGKEARITYEENRVYQMKCYSCHNTMLHEDRSFDKAVEFFEHHTGLVQAEKDGWLVSYMPGDTIYDRFGMAWTVTSAEIHKLNGTLRYLYRCGHPGTFDYCALFSNEILTREETEAALAAQKGDTPC